VSEVDIFNTTIVRNCLAISCIAGALLLPARVAAGQSGVASDEPVRIAPEVLARPGEHGIGRMVPNVPLHDLSGDVTHLADVCTPATRAVVIALRDAQCPLSRKFGPTIARIERDFAQRGVVVVHVNVSEVDTPADMLADVKRFDFAGRYVADDNHTIASMLAATSTTEVFVLDAARTLVYRGAINDQYGIGYARSQPRETYLIDALEAVLAGQQPAIALTTAPGCVIDVGPAGRTDAQPGVTYHNRISRIMQRDCLSCHRSGAAGPFALETYEQVAGRRAMIRYVVDQQLMPPWHAADAGGPWLNDRRLPEEDRQALLGWIEDGCAEGDPADAPLARAFAEGWSFDPDAVLVLDESFDVPAEGALDYRYTYLKTNFPEDKWITAVEIQPSQPQVVHHVLVFEEEPRREDETRREFRQRWQGGVRGYFAALVPGQGATIFPEGFAKKLTAGTWLKLQLHYTPNGEAVTDRPRIALKFSDEPPAHEVRTSAVATTRFRIPPGEANHVIEAEIDLPHDVTIMSFAPHMHLRGKAFTYDVTHPDGTTQTLIDIPRYDFNWQTCYRLLEPVTLPAGSVLKVTATFDNSEDNPANPDPTRAVGFGEQTWDEMMIGYFEWYRAGGE